MKMKQKGIAVAVIAVIVIVVVAVAGAGALLVLRGGGGAARNATATVKLHDARVINIADWADQHLPDIPGLTITITGTVTINSFSATNVTVKLHNQNTDEWITIIEGQTITDLTTGENLTREISSGTYDKVSIYIGTVSANVDISDIVVTVVGTIDPTQYGAPAGTPSINIDNTMTVMQAQNINQQFAVNKEFVLNLSPVILVTEGENQVFDVDTNAPFDLDFGYQFGTGPSPDFDVGEMEAANMKASGE